MSDLFGQTKTIKAISLWQPWASLVARGVKRHETRHWLTAYRGPIAIHAAKTLDMADAPDPLCDSALGVYWKDSLPLGAVVAIARLRDVRPGPSVFDSLTRADQTAGNFAHGRFAWDLADVRALGEPIPLAGRQGLFNWEPPDDLDDRLGPVLDHAAICERIRWGVSNKMELP